MCKTPKPNNAAVVAQQEQEAAEARRREEERQGRLTAGRDAIRSSFAGYDDGYFRRFEDSFIAANEPALQQQQANDAEQAIYGLARAGISNSSAANSQRERLAKAFALQTGQMRSAAVDAAQTQRQNVADTQQRLEAQLVASEDPAATANAATAQAKAIDRTPGMTTGQWLTPVVNAAGFTGQAYSRGSDQGYYATMGARLFPNAGGSGSGSVRAVR